VLNPELASSEEQDDEEDFADADSVEDLVGKVMGR
jgi:hypothetical protein